MIVGLKHIRLGVPVGDKTGIAWTDATWNPTRGCRRVSPGCENCYAERTAIRMSNKGGAYDGLVKLSKSGPRWTGAGRLVPEVLLQPLRWQKPRRIFVDSMSDLFFEKFTNEEIAAVFGAMAASPHHIFQVLTKRPERMEKWMRWARLQTMGGDVPDIMRLYTYDVMRTWHETIGSWLPHFHGELKATLSRRPNDFWPLHNVHLGVSVEDQEHADERIPILLATPAAVRFVSYEPALTGVTFEPWIGEGHGLDWIIVGGESGPGARPFDLEWARSTVAQGNARGVPVFVKQMGSNAVDSHDMPFLFVDVDFKKKGADPSEWPPELRVQQFPTERS